MNAASPLPFDPIERARDNWVASGWGEHDAMAAVTSIVRVHQLLLARLDKLLRPFDLTFARYEVLSLLALSSAGSLPMGKVGERLQVHPASVTNAITRLEESGYVVREPDPSDGRGRLARLTREGARVQRKTTRALANARFGLGGLDDGEAQRVTELLRKVRVAAGDFSE